MAWRTGLVKVATMQMLIVAAMPLLGCRASKSDSEAEAPPPAQVNVEGFEIIRVEHPENFPVVRATAHVVKIQASAIGEVVSNSSLSAANVSTDFRSAWIECAVYRSDIASLKVGAEVEIQMKDKAARTFIGHVVVISPASGAPSAIAKVRIAASAAELLPGEFVIAAFPVYRKQVHAALPESTILNFGDRHWVYVASGKKAFRRMGVVPGSLLPHGMEEIVEGVQPAEGVVQNPRELLRSLEP